jgi:hypothetical protein
MKILLHKLKEGIGHQILDSWHAYQQHFCKENNYFCDIQWTETDQIHELDQESYDLRIILLGVQQAETLDEHVYSQYDLILICNGAEPLHVGSPAVKKILSQHHNTYLVSNSYLTCDHEMFTKTIWFSPYVQNCRDYWTRHFYPQYFENKNYELLPRKDLITFINGQPRSNRQYFIDLCLKTKLNLQIKSSLGKKIVEVADSQWESDHDIKFKNFVNNLYQTVWMEHSDYLYYDQSPVIGINGRFGLVPPGYFILPLYFENYCVVFPESGWQNNELNVTEKALKCFYAGCLPFPVAGANVNKLYNEIGFYTAWNLLPVELKLFDSELDHDKRYQATVECLKWFEQNPTVFSSQEFSKMVDANKRNFLTCNCDLDSVKKFDLVIQKHVRS